MGNPAGHKTKEAVYEVENIAFKYVFKLGFDEAFRRGSKS